MTALRPLFVQVLTLVLCAGLLMPVHAAPPVQIQGPRILLGDLTATLPKDLAAVDVGPAPAPGKRARVTRAGLQSALRRAGADPELADAMPSLIQIQRAAKTLPAQALEAEVRTALQHQLPKGVRIARLFSVSDVVLPVGEHRLEVVLGPLRPSTTATLKLFSQNRLAKSLPIQVILAGTPKLPVLTDKIKRNAVVPKSKVRLQPTAWDQVSSRSALFTEQLVGQRARQALPAGRVLAHSAVAPVPAIARGHEVSVSAVAHGIRIVLPATAQEDGALGQYIRVRPRSGTRTLRAKVISANEVRIDLELAP